MFNELNSYTDNGHFQYRITDNLVQKCNAPTDKNGIYLVYALAKGKIELIYIGISGLKQKDGTIKTRKAGLGGMKDRIVNGHQFGKTPRKKSWAIQMMDENILALDIYWYVTYNETIQDIPKDVEKTLLKKYTDILGVRPKWNKQF